MNIAGPIVWVLALVLLFCTPIVALAQAEPYRVLILNSFRHTLPVNTDWYNGLVRGFTAATDLRVEIYIESPDVSRFGDSHYVSNLLAIYRRKYEEEKPHLIVPTYTPALQFLLDHGESLFPGIPIIFCGADSRFVGSQELMPHITGVTIELDVSGTLELALQIHPGTQRVAVIVGSSAVGKQIERNARESLQPFEGRVDFIWLQGMSHAELTEAVSTLPAQSVILYLTQIQDRTGRSYIPANHLPQLSAAASAPIYGLWDTLLGHGITGGRLITLENDGFQTAQMALRVLGGEDPAGVAVVDRAENSAIFDDRELTRWNIDEGRLPAGSRIVNRELSVWEKYSTEIAIVATVVALQGLLIAGLLRNRANLSRTQTALLTEIDLRTHAQTETHRLMSRLEKFSKERSLISLTTAIAHEINQPLIAIQNYAQAARRRLQSKADQTTKIDELIRKTEQQVVRASDIIEHVRNLVCTDEVYLQAVPLDHVLEKVVQIMEPELEDSGIGIERIHPADLPLVLADTLEIQLVLVNLLQNAMRSVQPLGDPAERVVNIEVRQISDHEVRVSVADRGGGVSLDEAEHIFEPLHSGRGDGMGMGLAICQTILTAHGGHIWYTPNPAGGAIFHFTLQIAAA